MAETPASSVVTIWQHLIQGDSLSRGVVLLLLIMSVATWVVILWKVWMLRRAAPGVNLSIAVFWQSSDLSDAAAKLHATDAEALVRPLVLAAQRASVSADAKDSATLERTVDRAQLLTRLLRDALVDGQQRLQFGQVLLATVGATAPFVGLLGTVWGIYHALLGMAAEGQVTIDQVSGPVGEALVMTAAGLGVAIPAVLAYNVLGRVSARIEATLEAFAHDVRELVLSSSDRQPAQNA